LDTSPSSDDTKHPQDGVFPLVDEAPTNGPTAADATPDTTTSKSEIRNLTDPDAIGATSEIRNPKSEIERSEIDRRWIFVVLLISMLAIDQAIKYWAEAHLSPTQWLSWPWPGVFELRLTHNKGIAFGMAPGRGGWFTPIALLISFGTGWYSWKHPKESAWLHTAMALLAAGALGNLYDRIRFGYVRDMFATRFISFPVFNWADTCITVATILLILVWTKEAFDARVRAQPIPTQPGDEPI